MKNLEIKVATSNIEEIKNKAIKISATNNGILRQIDTYFLVGKRRLKLREQGKINYLVYYLRGDTKESKLSKYYVLNIAKFFIKFSKKIFTIIFGVKIIVNKKRELFIYKNTRIHLDEVENIGTYIELETVFNKNFKEEDLVVEHNFVINSLGLNNLEKISNSYSDLLINGI